MADNFIGIAEVVRRTGLSKSTIYRAEKEGAFPRRVQIGKRRVAFVEAEVDHWIAEQINAGKVGAA